MVFQDYELIHTKRVNRIRRSMDVYNQRMWLAYGGYNSVFFAFTAGALSVVLLNVTAAEVIPTRAFFSKIGLKHYLRTAGLRFWLPVLSGSSMGVAAFGDIGERTKLVALRGLYEKELEDYKREVYYS